MMEHFTKRLYAYVIDFIVVFLLISLVNNILFIPLSLLRIPIISAYYPYVVAIIVTLAYFTIMESKTHKTAGKMVTELYVSDEEGYLSYTSAFIRSLPKCFFVFLIIDVILGKLFNLPSRLFDKLAGTDVYSNDELETFTDENSDKEDKKSTSKVEDKATEKSTSKVEDKKSSNKNDSGNDKKSENTEVKPDNSENKSVEKESETDVSEKSSDKKVENNKEETVKYNDESKKEPVDKSSLKESNLDIDEKLDKTENSDEILDLIIEDESDDFEELTADDFKNI